MRKATTRVLSMVLCVIILFGVVPTTVWADGIDEPLNSSAGSGWEDFDGSGLIDDGSTINPDAPPPPTRPGPGQQPPDPSSSEPTGPNSSSDDGTGNADVDVEDLPPIDENPIDSGTPTATPGTLGFSGDAALFNEGFKAYQAWAESLENSIQVRAGISIATTPINLGGTISWPSADPLNPYYISGYLPKITIAGEVAFCGEFNGNSPAGSYTLSGTDNNPAILKLMANYAANPNNSTYVAAQIGIWQYITTGSVNLSKITWGGATGASAASAIFNGSASYSGKVYQLYIGGTQDVIKLTGDKLENPYVMKIIKKNEDGSAVISGAEFSVTGPSGFSKTGLKTNSSGEIIVGIDNVGQYTVTETKAPAGYDLADPNTKTVNVSASNSQSNPASVEFYNKKNGEPTGGDGESETTTDTETNTETHNSKTYEYSDAVGQITIRKHDQHGNSLDGALFNIRVDFTSGAPIIVTNWEVDNGARLFTWTHPQDNHDPATVTVTEVQAPLYYDLDPTPQTAVVNPTYTRVTHVETWTVTTTVVTSTTTITKNGEVIDTQTSEASSEVKSEPQVEEFTDFVVGDRETTVTFRNDRQTGDIIVTKRDANTGQPLTGAHIHLWGEDLGDPNHIDKTLITDANGEAKFAFLPPGTYAIQETQAPFGYNLNNEIQNAVLQSNQIVRKDIRNYRKDGLIIKKVDQNGEPLSGAVFELRRGSGEVLLREVTNENGIIFRDYLTDDTYVIEEISAPEGYLLDENPIQSIRIYDTDDNKSYTVTFVNKKKPSIEVTKVDGIKTSIKLPGAVFRITDTRTNNYWDITTGANGTAMLENLEINTTYIVEEIEAPAGYVNSGYRQEIVLKECRVHTISVSNFEKPGIQIVKKDKATGKFLEGAVFRISWNSGGEYRDVTTGPNGKVLVTGLNEGWYTITETKAPVGYLLNSTPEQVLLEGGKTATVEFFDEQKPSLKIIKRDSVVNELLPNAIFQIYRKDVASETYIGEYTTNEDGEILLPDILPGRYLIRETKAPDGYNIDLGEKEVTIEYGKVVTVEFLDTPKSPIFILKTDETGKPLAGAKMLVKTMNGSTIGTYTTGLTGYAIVPYAEPGWYVVEEVRAPEGYILSSTPVNVELKSGRPSSVEFVNYMKPQLSILKLDSTDRKALMGARIIITKSNGELIGIYTSDNAGLITLTDILPGNYVVTEIAAPDGYILDSTAQLVELKAGESKQIELLNTPKPGLQLRKLDKLTNLPVKNAVFSLVRLESGAKRDMGSFTTGENGLFYVPDLLPGNYVLTEIKAPDGYIMDSSPQNLFIEGGKLNTVEVFNTPYSSLRLLKISADDARKPLAGGIFKLFDERRLEVGTYETSALGEIYVSQIPAGTYYLQETKAPAGYVLDTTVHKIELVGGKTTVVEIKNTELGTLRILKRSKEDKRPLYNATFLLYDSKNNLLGEFSTDQNGLIVLGKNIMPGTYKLKEIKAPDGFVLDETVRTISVKEGETTELVVENEPIRGRIQITKKAAEYNDITKDKKGALLKDAVFEIIDKEKNIVDRIETDSRGLATSKPLPIGIYGIREITAPKHYLLDDKVFYAEIKLHDDLIQFEVLNTPVDISVTVQKYGNYEAMPGDSIRYDFKDIANTSTIPLDDFYFHDAIPTDAVRLTKISTGTWNERLTYNVTYATNLRKEYRVLEDNLNSKTVNEIDCLRETIKLKNGEYITDIKFEFGTVQAGFREVTQPFIQCTVNGDLPNEYRFTNRCDVGGQHEDEWAISKDAWVSIIYAKSKGKLPKTGM